MLLGDYSVQLRSHPTLSYQGFNLWPPPWIRQGKSTSIPRGEVGVLRDVRWYPDNPLGLFLTMEHEGAEYHGRLLMEYDLLSMAMWRVRNCRGMTIDIGHNSSFVLENAAQP